MGQGLIFLLFLFLLLSIGGISFYTLSRIFFKGKWIGLLIFLTVYLSVYFTLQILAYQATQDILLPQIIQYSKDIILILAFSFWFLYQKDIAKYSFRFHRVDILGISFMALAVLFLVLPIGLASFPNKLIYFKSMGLVAVMYFLGRNMMLSKKHILWLLHTMLAVLILAFVVASFEKLFNIHLQSLIGYEAYHIALGGEPEGAYGLSWTFQAASGAKRFAAFFASPLEFGVFANLCFAVSLILFKVQTRFRVIYVITAVMSVFCLLYSYSRAPIAGFFLMLFFLAIIYGYWRYLLSAFIILLVFVGSIFWLGSEDLRFFFLDTITLSDSSSLGHVLEWIRGVESMASNPFGLGLATSGNGGGVLDDLQVGGENQFIIYGVQMGVLGLFIYLLLVIYGIKYALKAYQNTKGALISALPFVAASFKVSFIMSLMTANAEIYGYVVWISWWMVGYSIQYVSYPNKIRVYKSEYV